MSSEGAISNFVFEMDAAKNAVPVNWYASQREEAQGERSWMTKEFKIRVARVALFHPVEGLAGIEKLGAFLVVLWKS